MFAKTSLSCSPKELVKNMIYFGYCKVCNYADASTTYLDIYETMLEHQEKAHGHVEAEKIHILVSCKPYREWLMKSPNFWHTWRNLRPLTLKFR